MSRFGKSQNALKLSIGCIYLGRVYYLYIEKGNTVSDPGPRRAAPSVRRGFVNSNYNIIRKLLSMHSK